jgi:hypothetical protein
MELDINKTCGRCLGTDNVLVLKSKKKKIKLCKKCFDLKNSGLNLIKGHGYKIIESNG